MSRSYPVAIVNHVASQWRRQVFGLLLQLAKPFAEPQTLGVHDNVEQCNSGTCVFGSLAVVSITAANLTQAGRTYLVREPHILTDLCGLDALLGNILIEEHQAMDRSTATRVSEPFSRCSSRSISHTAERPKTLHRRRAPLLSSLP